MRRTMNPSGSAVLAAMMMVVSANASAALITALTGFGDFTSTTTSSQDFESSINTSVFTFDATAATYTAAAATSGVTSSGSRVLVEFPGVSPLRAGFTSDVFEIGMIFGNDDTAAFTATLAVFDASDVLLGSVTATPNGNDFADQFIGLRSDMAIRSMTISYGGATCCAIAIDDFTVGFEAATVPEPATLTLLGLGLAGLGYRRKREAA